MRPNRDQVSLAIGWALWLGAQASVLAVFAYRVPVSSKFPAPMENASAIAVVLVQMVLATMLSPVLFRDARSVLCGIAGATPMTLLAILLSGQPWTTAIAPALVAGAWFGVLGLPNALRPTLRIPLHALLLILSAGAPVMIYLVNEFVARPPAATGWLPWASPSLGAASTCLHDASGFWLIAPPLGILLGASVWNRARKGFRSTPTPTESDPTPQVSA